MKDTLLNPLDILNINRLDIVIKYLYAKYILLEQQKDNYIIKLYEKHIYYRTIYNNKFSDGKESVEQYKKTFEDLFYFVKNNKIIDLISLNIKDDEYYPNDGAHRIALGILFNISIKYNIIENKNKNYWGLDWLKNNNFNEIDINYVLYHYFLLKSNTNLIILYSPVIKFIDVINKYFNDNNIKILHTIDVNFTENYQLKNILREIYSIDNKFIFLKNNCVILKKYEKLINFDKILKVIFIDKFDKNIKTDIRNLLKNDIKKEDYITCHSSDSNNEKIHLLNIILNFNTMKMINLGYQSNLIDKYLNNYLLTLNKIKININDSIIVGSSILDIYNIRKTTDIDFALSLNNRKKCGFSNKAIKLNDFVDIVSQNYSYHNNQRKGPIYNYIISDDNLINNPLYYGLYRGLKVCSIEVIYDVKSNLKRIKDIEDISLINNLNNILTFINEN